MRGKSRVETDHVVRDDGLLSVYHNTVRATARRWTGVDVSWLVSTYFDDKGNARMVHIGKRMRSADKNDAQSLFKRVGKNKTEHTRDTWLRRGRTCWPQMSL